MGIYGNYGYNGFNTRNPVKSLDVECTYHPQYVICSCGKKTRYTFTNVNICKSCFVKVSSCAENEILKRQQQAKKQYEYDTRKSVWENENRKNWDSWEHKDRVSSLMDEARKKNDAFAIDFLASIKKCIERGWQVSEKQQTILNKFISYGLVRETKDMMNAFEKGTLEKLYNMRKSGSTSFWYRKSRFSSMYYIFEDIYKKYKDTGELTRKQYKLCAKFLEDSKKKTEIRESIEDGYRS